MPGQILIYVGIVWAAYFLLSHLIPLLRQGRPLAAPWEYGIVGAGYFGVAMLLLVNLNGLWVDHFGVNGALYSQYARVIARHGFDTTMGYCYLSSGPQFDATAPVYANHPPGLIWGLAVMFKIFGSSEGVARLFVISFSLFAAASVAYMMYSFYGSRTAVAIFPVLAASPSFTYFGRMVNFEPVLIAVTVIFYSLLLLRKSGCAMSACLLFLLAMMPLIDWAGGVTGIVGAVALGRIRYRNSMVKMVLAGCLVVSIFVLTLGYSLSAWGGISAGLETFCQNSMKWFTSYPVRYTPLEWIAKVVHNAITLNPVIVVLPIASIAAYRLYTRDMRWFLVGVTLPFVLIIPMMPKAVYAHDYHMAFWWPSLAVMFALLIQTWRHRIIHTLTVSMLILLLSMKGIGTMMQFHRPEIVSLHLARVGMSLNRIVGPSHKVAIINTTAKPYSPILVYYLDRKHALFRSFDDAKNGDAYDYYCFASKYRWTSAEEQAGLNNYEEVRGAYAPTYRRRIVPVRP